MAIKSMRRPTFCDDLWAFFSCVRLQFCRRFCAESTEVLAVPARFVKNVAHEVVASASYAPRGHRLYGYSLIQWKPRSFSRNEGSGTWRSVTVNVSPPYGPSSTSWPSAGSRYDNTILSYGL